MGFSHGVIQFVLVPVMLVMTVHVVMVQRLVVMEMVVPLAKQEHDSTGHEAPGEEIADTE